MDGDLRMTQASLSAIRDSLNHPSLVKTGDVSEIPTERRGVKTAETGTRKKIVRQSLPNKLSAVTNPVLAAKTQAMWNVKSDDKLDVVFEDQPSNLDTMPQRGSLVPTLDTQVEASTVTDLAGKTTKNTLSPRLRTI